MVVMSEATLHCCRQYFATYGPCTERDVRYWTGIVAGASRNAVRVLLEEGSVEEVMTDLGPLMMPEEKKGGTVAEEGVRLVGHFEPTLLAHRDKSWIIGERKRKRVWNTHSDMTACVVRRGRIRGTRKREGSNRKVRLFVDGDGAFEEQDIEKVFQEGEHVMREFYTKRREVIIEREKADGEVEELRDSKRRGEGGSVDRDDDGGQKRRLRKWQRRI